MPRLTSALVAVALALFTGAARADLLTFAGTMSGSEEVPPSASPATGSALLTLDTSGDVLTVDVTWSGLIGGPAAAAHIHCCTLPGTSVNVAIAFPGFPAAQSGTYQHVFDLTVPNIYTSSFLTNFGGGTAAGAEAALVAGLEAGQAYVNIHNATFPGGEIRSFVSAVVPEPGTLALVALATAAVPLVRRRR